MESFRTSEAARFDHVMYTSSIITACYAADLRSKTRLRVKSGGVVRPLVSNLDELSDRNAHRIEWSVQHIVMAWDQLATSVGVRSTEELLQQFTFLRRPWAHLGAFDDERDEVIVSRDEAHPTLLTRARQGTARSPSISCRVSLLT